MSTAWILLILLVPAGAYALICWLNDRCDK